MRSDHRCGVLAALTTIALVLASLLLATLGLGSASAEDATSEPSPTSTSDALDVSDAVLRWGLNTESSSAAFFGRNFLSAGKLPDRGAGSNVAQADWSAQSGRARIEQYSSTAGAYRVATWSGVTTGAAGSQQVVLSGGTGSVDPGTGDAEIRWTGSFTVVYYSGLSFFYVTDPVLSVDDGHATLSATLGGYGSSQSDTSQWVPLTPRQVRLADLGTVDLTADDGFTVTPAYRGVTVTTPSGAAVQVRTGADWGAFPQAFVDFQAATGLSSYWYSSGASTDAGKVALPISVSYDADRPVTAPTPSAQPSEPAVTNSAIARPSATATVTVTAAPAAPVGAGVVGLPAVAPPAATVPSLTTAAVRPAPTVLALTGADTTPVADTTRWPWWVGSALLLLAAALVPVALRRPRI